MPFSLATWGKCQKPMNMLSGPAPEGQGLVIFYHQIAHEAMLVVVLGDIVNDLHM